MKLLRWVPFIKPHLSKICNVCKKDTRRCVELQGSGYNHRTICDGCLKEMVDKLERK